MLHKSYFMKIMQKILIKLSNRSLYVLLLLSQNLVIKALGLGVALLPGVWPGAWFYWQLHPPSKFWPKPWLGDAEARMLQEFPHSMFNLFLMCGYSLTCGKLPIVL
jgi:hypothetical protein